MDGDEERSLLAKVTLLQFIAALCFFSFLLYSCFSSAGYNNNNNNNNIQLSTLVFSLFAHSLDRNYMFLICNGIVAFLVKTFTFSSSSSSFSSSSSSSSSSFSSSIKSAQDSVTQTVETTTLLVQENAASSAEYGISTVATEEEMKVEDEDEDEDGVVQENIGEEEINVEMKVEDESDYEEEEEEVEVEENKGEKEIEVSDVIVSTEELNHKFEEFIRKMKEEIRIEALQQQQLVAAS